MFGEEPMSLAGRSRSRLLDERERADLKLAPNELGKVSASTAPSPFLEPISNGVRVSGTSGFSRVR